MEQQVIELLQATTVPDTNTINKAERSLTALHSQSEYPVALLAVATHSDINLGLRKAALIALRNYVDATWADTNEGGIRSVANLSHEAKSQIRSQVLAICLSTDTTNDSNQTIGGKFQHDGSYLSSNQAVSRVVFICTIADKIDSERGLEDSCIRLSRPVARIIPKVVICCQ